MNKYAKDKIKDNLEKLQEVEHSLSQLVMRHSFLYLALLDIRKGMDKLEHMVKEIDYL